MKINLHRIVNDDMTFDFQEPAGRFRHLLNLGGSGEPAFEQPLSGRLRVARIKDVVRVTGHLQTVVEIDCSRCLKRFEHQLKCSLELTFAQQPSDKIDEELPDDYQLDARQAGLIYFSGDEIDLREALSEQIIMALPYKPLCRDTCKGLCSRCGADLNEASCRCNDTPPDGPFAILKQLKKSD